uniref:FTH domain-containing protein n=1 Tax=Caenorhabditis tropicalis TaxID=1561998 RepID=A0A1I7T7I9_9PELO
MANVQLRDARERHACLKLLFMLNMDPDLAYEKMCQMVHWRGVEVVPRGGESIRVASPVPEEIQRGLRVPQNTIQILFDRFAQGNFEYDETEEYMYTKHTNDLIMIIIYGGCIKITQYGTFTNTRRFKASSDTDYEYLNNAAKDFHRRMKTMEVLEKLVINVDEYSYNIVDKIEYIKFIKAILRQEWLTAIRVRRLNLFLYNEAEDDVREPFMELWERFDIECLKDIRLRLKHAPLVPFLKDLEKTEKWRKANCVEIDEKWTPGRFLSFQPKIGNTRMVKIKKWTIPRLSEKFTTFYVSVDDSSILNKSTIQVEEPFNMREVRGCFPDFTTWIDEEDTYELVKTSKQNAKIKVSYKFKPNKFTVRLQEIKTKLMMQTTNTIPDQNPPRSRSK